MPLLAAITFGLLAWGSIALTRDTGRVAALWLPNAYLVGIVLRYSVGRSLQFLLPSFIANVAANLLVGDPIRHAAGLALCNSLEIVIVTTALRWRCGTRPDLSQLRPMAWLALFGGIVAPSASGFLASLILAPPGQLVATDVWLTWELADGLGLVVVTPILSILLDGFRRSVPLSPGMSLEWAAILIVGTLSVVAIFFQTHFPLLFMATPFVMLSAFRLGTLGAAIAISVIALIASIATTIGYGPIHLVNGDLATKVIVLQGFLLFTFVSALPVAAALNSIRHMERQLRDSRDFAQSILENMREIVFRTDTVGRWTFLNPAWARITGYSVEESLGWPTTKLLRAEDFHAAMKVYPQIVSGELDECVLRQRFFRADGATRDIEVSVRAIRDADGTFVGTSGNIRDITDERANHAALEASEARFRTLADSAPVGIYRADLEASITYVNTAWSEITGLSQEATLGQGWRNALVDLGEFERRPSGTGLEQPGDRSERELNFRTGEGKQTWIRVVSAAEFDGVGERVGYIGVVADITGRKQAEIELAARGEQLKLFAENVTDAVFRLTLDGRCMFVTPSVKEVLGFRPEHLVGENMLTGFHPEDTDQVLKAYAALAKGEAESMTVTYRSRPGGVQDGWVWLEANSKLVRDPATNVPMEVIASIRNVTKRRELELQRDEALRSAEAAAAAKTSFLANMSHEIRTPMNGVIGFTELLLQGDLNDEQRHHAQLIAESGRTMMRLLNDILDLSKIDAGQMTIVNDAFDVRHALRSSLRLMSVAAERKGLSLELDIADDFPQHIMGDSLRLRQVLANLIGNAIKFTEKGGITLSARVERAEGIIEVADTGIGIAPERQKAIFEEFVQENEATSRRFGGTGLGLAISRRLVTLMGGTLGLRSSPGQGTTMIATLPLAVAEPSPANQDPGASAARLDTKEITAAPRRVLLAEDHDINQLLATALLERLGCEVDLATNGQEAIDCVVRAAERDEPYRMIFMDMQMPEIDGLEATRQLRAMGFDAAALPIVALTANAYEDDVAACFAAGMQGHLPKPLQMAELERLLTRFTATRIEWLPQAPDPAIDRLRTRYIKFRGSASTAFTKALAGAGVIDEVERATLRTLAHKLSGTAAMFGDAPIGDAARVIDEAVATNADDGALRAAIGACLELLTPDVSTG